MRTIADYRLKALLDMNCEVILALMRKGMTIKELKTHIEIDDGVLAKKLGLLQKAKLIKNKLVVMYLATEDGEKALREFGHEE